jgi:hypothetical protein
MTGPTAAQLAAHLGLNAGYDNTRLQTFADGAWGWLTRALGRDFSTGARTESYRGNGTRFLVLKNYPIASLESITLTDRAQGTETLNVDESDPLCAVVISNTNAGILERIDGGYFRRGSTIATAYHGGAFDATSSPNAAPPEVWLAVLEAAAYVYQTTGGRSAVTGGSITAQFMSLVDGLRSLPAVQAAIELWSDPLARKL